MSISAPFSNLTPLQFLPTDANALLAQLVNLYEQNWLANTGQSITLVQSDPRYQQLQAYVAMQINLRGMANLAYNQNLLPFAQGEFLDALVALLGPNANRQEESFATVTLQFTLSSVQGIDSTVPAGTLVSVTGNSTLAFATNSDLTIPAGLLTGTVTATCTTIGSIGNDFLPGQISSLVNWTQPFVVSATNIETSQGGNDTESDTAMRARDFLVTETYTTAGTYGSYTELALAANPGIQNVSVVGPESDLIFPPIYLSVNEGSNPGQIPPSLSGTQIIPGQVYVTVLMDGGAMPNQAVCSEVYSSVTAFNPLTDQVFVNGPEPVNFNLNVQFWRDSEAVTNETTDIANITAAANTWLYKTQQKLGRSVDPTSLIGAMYNAGASRVNVISPSYIPVNPWQIAIPSGTPTITYISTESDFLN